jgi:two-component system, OmpR family, phosphate regulon response regulator OmpR
MSALQPHVLVVDDDKRLRDLIGRYLTEQGFRVSMAVDAASARAKLTSLEFDLLVLDIMMPGESGLDLTRALRQDSAVPILLLTAMAEPPDRIRGLELGADDYLTKPFEPKELVLRINAILKRVAGAKPPGKADGIVRFGAYTFELERRRLLKKGTHVYLTEAETDLLALLARRLGNAVSREELMTRGLAQPAARADAALAPEDPSASDGAGSRQVDVQMTRLRKKIESDPRFPRYLQTVRGIGYMLQPD